MKKVLSLVLAAAMALGVTATAFAAGYDGDYVFDTIVVDGVETSQKASDVAPGVGKTWVSPLSSSKKDLKLSDGNVTVTYTVVASANKNYANDIHVWNFEETVKVKGPAEITSSRIQQETFKTWDDGTRTYAAFDVTFKIKANNEAATAMKQVVITYGAKVLNAPSRSGLKGKTDAKDSGWSAGYDNIDEDTFYNDVVNGYDDMVSYDENSFTVDMNNNPVIPSSAIKFLQKNLGNSKSVIFIDNTGTVYADGAVTLELTGKAIKEFPSNSHANVKVNKEAVDEIKDALDEADVDNTWFNYVVSRSNIEATHSFDSGYNDPHVYLVNEDGSLTEVEVKDYDYGDVAFTGPMTQYVITEGAIPAELFEDDTTDEPIEDDDLIDEPTEDDDNLVDEDGNPIENNPGTGSSNAISLAVAMAVVSLAAAGLVATKKASK